MAAREKAGVWSDGGNGNGYDTFIITDADGDTVTLVRQMDGTVTVALTGTPVVNEDALANFVHGNRDPGNTD